MVMILVGGTGAPLNDRIAFIHVLRGVAPLMVLWAHLGGWWLAANHRTSRLQDLWINIVDKPFHLYQDGGHLGVLIFFLVSGFVITHVSLRETKTEFAIKRAFRLLPPLWLAFAAVAVLSAVAARLGLPPILGPMSDDYISSLTLWNWIVGKPGVLSVVWTLWIEIMFYTLTGLLIGVSRSRPVLATWLMIAIPLLGNMAMQEFPFLVPLMFGLMYIPFLLVGRSVYLAWSGRVAVGPAVCVGISSYAVFALVYNNLLPGYLFQQGNEVIISHAIALIAFLSLCFSGIQRVPRAVAFCADISYSLYLFHAPLGSFFIYILVAARLPYEGALPIAVAGVMAVCWGIYVFIERPSQRLGRTVTLSLVRGTTVPIPGVAREIAG